jgi:hypothetical protein
VTEKQKQLLKKISKIAAYTAITGGAYFLAKGAISLLFKQLETKIDTQPEFASEKAESPFMQAPDIIETSALHSATP